VQRAGPHPSGAQGHDGKRRPERRRLADPQSERRGQGIPSPLSQPAAGQLLNFFS
jgi:hypothetical protein